MKKKFRNKNSQKSASNFNIPTNKKFEFFFTRSFAQVRVDQRRVSIGESERANRVQIEMKFGNE